LERSGIVGIEQNTAFCSPDEVCICIAVFQLRNLTATPFSSINWNEFTLASFSFGFVNLLKRVEFFLQM